MCGRFTLFASFEDIIDRFEIESALFEQDYFPSYNVAPSHQVLAVINDGVINKLGHLRWGLIPPWAKDEKIGYKMINARAETLAEKPSFRNAFQSKRCLIPADSFYEWQQTENGKVAMRIKLKTNEVFAIAGLWESWKSPEGSIIHTCTAITTTPNSLVEPIHNRMPVILTKENESVWLDPTVKDPARLSPLLQPFDHEIMEAYAVSSDVNSPKNNSERLIVPLC